MTSIPASAIVSVNPSVINAGGSALDLNALVLTKSARVPIGSIAQFPDAAAVAKYFGSGTVEANCAAIYFAGPDGSSKKPGNILFAQKNGGNVAAYLRGGPVTDLTVVQAITSGTITIIVDGVSKTSSALNLAGATSFSNAAALIQAAFTTPGFTVTYDSISSGFLFTSNTTGATSTITFPTSSPSTIVNAALLLTATSGAVTSQGANSTNNYTSFLNNIAASTQNWASLMTVYDPDAGSGNTQKLNIAQWIALQNNRYVYACWDSDGTTLTTVPATTSMGYILAQSAASGTVLIYGTDMSKAAFKCGEIASLNFSLTNGRTNSAFQSASGLTPDITDSTSAANLLANGYNFYGTYATANDAFTFYYNGSISGQFVWEDSYVDQIWLNNELQLALMELLTNVNSIPYNQTGYSLIRAACQDPIDAAVKFGAIRSGVSLSNAQKVEVNNAVGFKIDDVLSSRGWYLNVADPGAQVRGQRGSPIVQLFYMDGGSVNSINVSSTLVL